MQVLVRSDMSDVAADVRGGHAKGPRGAPRQSSGRLRAIRDKLTSKSIPCVLWGMCPLLQYWLGRIWLIANRGELDADPIVFALRDGPSYVVGALAALTVWLATVL